MLAWPGLPEFVVVAVERPIMINERKARVEVIKQLGELSAQVR